MTATPEPEPEERAAPESDLEPEPSAESAPARDVPDPDQRPMSRFAHRFRVPLGILVALIGAGLAVVFAVRPLDASTGAQGLITQGAGVALWLCIVGFGVSWALDSSRKVSNGFVLAAVACYAIFWISGL